MNYHMTIRGFDQAVLFPRRLTPDCARILNMWLRDLGYHIRVSQQQLAFLQPGRPMVVGPLTIRVLK